MSEAFETRTIEESLGTLIDYRGKTPPKTESGVRLVTAKVIKDGYVQDDKKEFIAADFYDEWMRRGLPKQWDIVITTEAPLGEVAQLRTAAKVALAQRVILLRTNPDVYDQSFFFQALKGHFVQGELKARGTGTTVLGIKQSELRKVRVPWFSLPTQRKIASVLSAYDDLIENNTRRIAILEEMAQAIYREWFVNFRFPGHGHENAKLVDSPLGQIPEGWEAVRVKSLLKRLKASRQYKQADVTEEGTIPVIDQSKAELLGFHDDPPDFEASPSTPVVILGDHTCKMELMTTPFSIGPNVVPFISKTLHPVGFVFYVVKNLASTQEYKRHWTELNNNEICLGPTSIANDFEEVISPMVEEIALFRKKNRNLRTTRDLLLPKLISGKLDVEDLDIDVVVPTKELDEATV